MWRGSRLTTGGVVTQHSSTSVDITGGSGYIYDSSTQTETLVTWGPQSDFSVAADIASGSDASYVLIDSGGNFSTIMVDPVSHNLRDFIYLSKLAHRSGGSITSISQPRFYAEEPLINIHELTNAIGPINLTGNVISPYGSALQIQKSSGTAYRYAWNSYYDRKQPSDISDAALTPITFIYCQAKTGGGVLYTPSQTSIDSTQYDVGNSTLASTGSNFTNQRVYYFPRTNSIYVFYGRTTYASLDLATAASTKKISSSIRLSSTERS